MSKTFTAAEVREIVGLVIRAETGPVPPSREITTEGAKALFAGHDLGDLRHWGAFSEVFAFAYDPDTLEVHAVTRSNDFLGNPTADLLAELTAKHEGGSVEVWGIRHAWGRSVAKPGEPECLMGEGRRPEGGSRLQRVVQAAMVFEDSPGPSPR